MRGSDLVKPSTIRSRERDLHFGDVVLRPELEAAALRVLIIIGWLVSRPGVAGWRAFSPGGRRVTMTNFGVGDGEVICGHRR